MSATVDHTSTSCFQLNILIFNRKILRLKLEILQLHCMCNRLGTIQTNGGSRELPYQLAKVSGVPQVYIKKIRNLNE